MRSTLLLASLLAAVPFISATPARRDATFVPRVILDDGTTFSINGCHTLGFVRDEQIPEGGANNLTPRNCLATCHDLNYTQGGVGNDKCYCDKDTDGGPPVTEEHCTQWPCLGDNTAYCGSGDSLIFYSY